VILSPKPALGRLLRFATATEDFIAERMTERRLF